MLAILPVSPVAIAVSLVMVFMVVQFVFSVMLAVIA
jgi:hypothetical protein